MKWNLINYLKIDFLKNPALILFSFASFLYIMGGIYNFEYYVLISKSLMVPSILLYYIQSCKKIDSIVTILFFVFFFADIILTTNPENSLVWVVVLYIISYLIIFYTVITTFKADKDLVITKGKIYNIVFFVFLYLFIYFQFVDFIFDLNFEYKILYLIASIILLSLLITATVLCVLKQSRQKWFLILAVLIMLISNFIFVCQIYYVEYELLYFWALITQSFFYFFLIKFYLINNKREAAGK